MKGMAVALNLDASLSLAHDRQFVAKSKLDGREIPGSYSTVGVLSLGTTYSFPCFSDGCEWSRSLHRVWDPQEGFFDEPPRRRENASAC